MSFLEKEDAKPSTFWDWVIGVALLCLVGGFTYFYQYQKRYSRQKFQAADSLFQAGKFPEAERAYEELKGAQYLTTSHDSLIYARLDSVSSMEDGEKETLARARAKLAAGDTTGARAEIKARIFRGLLRDEDQAALDSIKVILR